MKYEAAARVSFLIARHVRVEEHFLDRTIGEEALSASKGPKASRASLPIYMPDPHMIVTIDDKIADTSAAYLAMWSALDSFNPSADHWSDPSDFGESPERISDAENAIARLRDTAKRVEPEIDEDIKKFRQYARLLRGGSSFDESIGQFSTYLRQRGSQLSDESVQLGKATPADTENDA